MPATPPPPIPDAVAVLTYPAPHVLHIAMNRPARLNAITSAMSHALAGVFDWFEADPDLRVAILGSTSARAWCVGADLGEWSPDKPFAMPRDGVAGPSKRITKKPVIAAIRGFAVGAGAELALGADLLIAGESATLSFPEARRGTTVMAGGVHRLVRTVGHYKAAELVLTGRDIPAAEALALGLLNAVVPDAEVDARALEMAQLIAATSPDSVQCGLYVASVTQAGALFADSKAMHAVNGGENIKEGIAAFQEKRAPVWRPSKL
ncbi:hypothetical protein Q8F55_007379 [Vanrija albida]|uniref:Enoyl-CoA hydratase n=1 Tax=Vanrija albida TaxID=181172 RepID=A0ABR3PTE4_9TREE